MSDADIPELIAGLAAKNGVDRQHARHRLEKLGPAAEDALIDALGDANDDVRWEAAKALTRVASGHSAQALLPLLGDENTGIRWLAAEALLRTGADGVEAILLALEQHPDQSRVDTSSLHEGAHHVFHAHQDKAIHDLVAPVVAALHAPGRNEATPIAASAALSALRSLRS